MQIDWEKTLEDILADKMSCPRCGVLTPFMVAGYSRSPAVADYAPRCKQCARKEDCDARKLAIVCENCARQLHLRARRVDREGMMTMLINDCRRDLEECLDYLADYWQEDLDVDQVDDGQRLEDVDPEVFEEEDAWRRRLEEEYLSYHRRFREQGLGIPNPGWRSEYVEEIIALGYTTLLGD
jgi:hypothetical protein